MSSKRYRTSGTGSLVRKGNSWYLQIRDLNGNFKTRVLVDPNTGEKARTKAHAERLAPLVASSLFAKNPKVSIDNKMSLLDLHFYYREAFQGRYHKTTERNHKTIINVLSDYFPKVSNISHESLGRFIRQRMAEPNHLGKTRAPATINRELAYLRRLLNWGKDTEKIDANPMQGFRFLREDNSRDRILSKEEIKSLLETIENEQFKIIRPMSQSHC